MIHCQTVTSIMSITVKQFTVLSGHVKQPQQQQLQLQLPKHQVQAHYLQLQQHLRKQILWLDRQLQL